MFFGSGEFTDLILRLCLVCVASNVIKLQVRVLLSLLFFTWRALLSWRWRHQVPPKRWYSCTKLHSAASQKTVILILLWEPQVSCRGSIWKWTYIWLSSRYTRFSTVWVPNRKRFVRKLTKCPGLHLLWTLRICKYLMRNMRKNVIIISLK
jgi:hypothetical protein